MSATVDRHPPIYDVPAWRVYLMHADGALEQRRRLAQARDAGMGGDLLAQVVRQSVRNLQEQARTAAIESNEAWESAVSLEDVYADGFE